MGRRDTQDSQGFEHFDDVEARLRSERSGLSPLALDRVRAQAHARARSAGRNRDLFGLQSGRRRLTAAGLTVLAMAAGTGSVLAAGGGNTPRVGAAAAQYAEVEPEVVVKGECKISEKSFKLIGAKGQHKTPFKVSIKSLGVKKITFYIDGKKYTTLKHRRAKHGKFTVKINPAKYTEGKKNTILAKTVMTDPNCAAIKRKGHFVHDTFLG